MAYTAGDDNQICLVDAPGAAEIRFSSFPSTTSIRFMLSVVPDGAASLVIQKRQWKSQNVDAWMAAATINSPVQGNYQNVTSLTQGTEYEFRAVAYAGADGEGDPNEEGNILRLRIPKSVHVEDLIDTIIATLKANLGSALDVVDAEYNDGIELDDVKDDSYYNRKLDPDAGNWNFPVVQIYEGGGSDDANNVGSRSLFLHNVVIETWLASHDAQTDKFKSMLRRYNKAIRAVVRANPKWGGMAVYTDIGGYQAMQAEGEQYTYAWASLKLQVQTYE